MPVTEPWQTAEIAGPKKASVISKPEVADAMIKRAKHPVLIIGHLAAEIDLDGKKVIDYLLDLIFAGRILHCHDHECARFARRGMLGTASQRG